jgi:protein-S-isoprenylcysteine O-methyltransferase Ste14
MKTKTTKGMRDMEKEKEKPVRLIVKIVLSVIVIAIGFFALAYGFLCLFVDGVHFVAYTISPAVALICFFAAWLLLRRKKSLTNKKAAGE